MAEQLDAQAVALNQAIAAVNPAVLAMLSARGRKIYFPKLGILAQSAEARGKAINATIGTALDEDGGPLCLSSLAAQMNLPKGAAFPYAPSPGLPEIREQWGKMMLAKNPGLAGKAFSQPIVTCALTHGLSMAAYLFCDAGDVLLTSDLYWENYDLLFGISHGAQTVSYPTFTPAGGFNLEGLRQALAARPEKKLLIALNFPNNPAGYTLLEKEVPELKRLLVAEAEAGRELVVLLDDAYFGLVFEEGVHLQSLFVDLCDAHPNLLAVKLDGPTKEDYVWGFRVGFITFGVKGGTPALYQALEGKCAGAIRANISNASLPAQSMLLAAWKNPAYAEEKRRAYELLKGRYEEIKRVLAAHPEYREEFVALPFNSGYFMCVKPLRADPERVRQKLLAEHSTGVCSLHGILRIAFSATPTAKIPALFANLYAACRAV
ncbi:MAG: aminotransferase class I/II-fold pyridoxal phosphate-dependent enzyme [Lentisphaeria bacterium]|jgi:aspartate/methionine/tyrosine aminotransferase